MEIKKVTLNKDDREELIIELREMERKIQDCIHSLVTDDVDAIQYKFIEMLGLI